ncbi:isochorismatase family protein [Chloroflexota bacterium]
MAIWDDVISQSDKDICLKSGHDQKRIELGSKPALVIIDVTYNFVGDKPEPILESIKRFPLSCGEAGWEVVHQIAALLPLVREKNIPIIYCTGAPRLPKNWARRNTKIEQLKKIEHRHDIVKEIAPTENDVVIHKYAYSIFHSTALVNVLLALRVDTLFFCGLVASGCVRASATDSCQYGFATAVIEECTGDQVEILRKVSLFDLDMKYGSVIAVSEAREYFSKFNR